MKIKVNDKVKAITGKDRGKEGKVIQVFSDSDRVVVEGLHIMKKHLRPQKRGEKGQVIELAAPMNISNVMLICPKCAKVVRVGYKVDGKTKKRVCRQCNEFID
ncbi:MAG: 50S ribosomal protein L24 [Candidatus Magasanikbacteria bacterium CG10_big_fil_rev_8_21_14_0_10_36_32]|uniref:Large ribosomal subunit protein uL24 n=1 Tax=Candidatus Magasanikbacteria bacterium CG10_big_fil_rev_8_21_14_0_10_36_32 TaxID=1974646 RepID=A0A2M6W6N5_9BACT|nr:MAG: 50S ribosomal protein L24 [Candidatus Magasanikbacteria bacterium CG10_big_fil_rev_8_21_14_0_10_36_32]